ncbi:MAG TPA: methyltransferase domain-containing protein [Gemmatimonadales bacterium]|jgi:SAM-dependent methyltransferase
MNVPPPGLPQSWSRVAHDYQRYIAPGLLPAARAMCRAVRVGAADSVLDVACGPGTAALAARELGAGVVVGVDFARGMITTARDEAASGAPAHFAVADALALPFQTGYFDVVISSFGLVFAPDPVRAAGEAARVLRRGGRLALLAWPPGGSVGAYQDAAFRHLAMPPSAHDPFQWGLPERARGWLGAAFERVELRPIDVPFDAASPAAAWSLLRTATGRVAAAYAELDQPGRARLDAEMERFFEAFRVEEGRVHWPRQAFILRAIRR